MALYRHRNSRGFLNKLVSYSTVAWLSVSMFTISNHHFNLIVFPSSCKYDIDNVI